MKILIMFFKKNYLIIILLSILSFLFVKDDYYNRIQTKFFKYNNSINSNIVDNSFDLLMQIINLEQILFIKTFKFKIMLFTKAT